MNILTITATYPPSANGVAISTKRSVSALRSLGHRVVVVGPAHLSKPEDDYLELPTVSTPFLGLADYPIPLPQPLPVFLRRLHNISWDIIHVHHPSIMGNFALALGNYLRTPVIFTYHTQYDQYLDHLTFFSKNVSRFLYNIGIKRQLKRFDGIIATTHWLQRQLEKEVDVPVMYASTAGLEKPFYVKQSNRSLRSTLGLPAHGPIFLSVSRLSKEKKTNILLRGFLRWAEVHAGGILVIIGDGNYRKQLETIARSHKQGSRVRFVGKKPNESLPPWYSVSTAFLYSSTTDTIGINILEAMSAGIPIVAPDHKTTREIVRSHYNGILYRGGPAMMAEALEKVMAFRKKLSQGARTTSTQYSIENTTQQLLVAYEKTISAFDRG